MYLRDIIITQEAKHIKDYNGNACCYLSGAQSNLQERRNLNQLKTRNTTSTTLTSGVDTPGFIQLLPLQ